MRDELPTNTGLPALSLIAATSGSEPQDATPHHAPARCPQMVPGGSRELLQLALPLILSQSFMTIQIAIDRVLLSRHNPDEVAAAFPAVMLFWLPFGLLQGVAAYVSTFVAQYTGAARPHRVGPAVWQGLYFAGGGGVLFLAMIPLAADFVALAGHAPELQQLEVIYWQYLAAAALPMLIVAAVNGFFSGRGQTWTVLAIDAVGTVVNAALALVLIFGYLGFPEMGIAGAGLSTALGAWASALLGLVLFFRPQLRTQFRTLTGWRFERELFGRLLRFGGPAGIQMFLDVLAFTLFTVFVGRLGMAAMGATSIAITLNMITFLPMIGLGQAISILVGQRLGEDRPDIAERTTYTGLWWMCGYMWFIVVIYLTLPGMLLMPFEPDTAAEQAKFAPIAAIVPHLLICVAIYSLADSMNLTFAFALRGAGDTQFVTWLTFLLAWPLMVIPSYLVVEYRDVLAVRFPTMGEPIYWAWGFATLHIVVMSICFLCRFRHGKWKTMRVIEPPPENDAS
ncbi:MAG: MATE family efflux transporter [Gemmataceae bacterium]|nr:MATE family efflux transporter [Gemmata sp.]MDW8198342.1 MATE family efflux transporter [Gemmataceae bacterium]